MSGCKITQLNLNLHPTNRSFLEDDAKTDDFVRHAGHRPRRQETGTRARTCALPVEILPLRAQDSHRIHPRVDRQRTFLAVLLHPEDVPHQPREPRADDPLPDSPGAHTHGPRGGGGDPPPRPICLSFALFGRHAFDPGRMAALPRLEIRRPGRRRIRTADDRHLETARRTGPDALPGIGVVRRAADPLQGQGPPGVGHSGHLAHRPQGAARQPYRRFQSPAHAPHLPPHHRPPGRRPGMRPRHADLCHG